jgi:hypothetical protein
MNRNYVDINRVYKLLRPETATTAGKLAKRLQCSSSSICRHLQTLAAAGKACSVWIGRTGNDDCLHIWYSGKHPPKLPKAKKAKLKAPEVLTYREKHNREAARLKVGRRRLKPIPREQELVLIASYRRVTRCPPAYCAPITGA